MKDEYVGYHRFGENGDEWGSFCVTHLTGRDGSDAYTGYYWYAGYPGCTPDSEICGPFDTSKAAYDDAMDF